MVAKVENKKAVFHFRTIPATAAAGCSHKRIMVAVEIESMGGGTTSSAEEMIQREISRVLVLNLSGQRSGAPALPRRSLSLTAPSLLSRGTPSPPKQSLDGAPS